MARATLAELDSLSFKNAARMPHPVELMRWREAGYYEHDLEYSVFRLTPLGKMAND